MAVVRPGVDEVYCSNCGVIIKRQSEFCSKCGVKVAVVPAPAAVGAPAGAPQVTEATAPGPDEIYCSSCGAIIKRRAEICMRCGVRVVGPPAAPPAPATTFSDKSRLTAGILGILLGGIGVHRIYLGNIGIGILQIVVSIITLGIGSLWGFVEGIIIIAGGNWKDSRGMPLRKYNQ
ncbi:MAG: TM2 domain-containing protein [Chloroflexi bacterium]|nr:TM2 domain-containing protein [Chloroflexota bacterium]